MSDKTNRSSSGGTSIPYVAFLRGINNIGSNVIKMEQLKPLFESAGFNNVRTVQASGNVLFETTRTDFALLTETIEKKLEKKLGHKVHTMLRTVKEIREIVDARPFGKINATARTKLLLTLLSEKPAAKLTVPYESPGKDFKILRVTKSEVYSIVRLRREKYPPIAAFLEKFFGRKITNRHWSTILKLLEE